MNRSILPALNAAGIAWHGWRAFRRGLGTNLYRPGIQDKTIQAILRRANMATTQAFYIKRVAEDSKLAMAKLQDSLVDRNWTGFPGVGARTAMVSLCSFL